MPIPGSSLLANISMKTIFQNFPEHHYQKGYTCIYPSDPLDYAYYIKEGYVRQYDISSKTGSQFTIHIFAPGNIFPLLQSEQTMPAPYFYDTFTAVKLFRAPQPQFKDYLINHPQILFQHFESLVNNLHGLVSRLRFMTFGDSYALTMSSLIYLSLNFGKQEKSSVRITRRFTHQEIAQLTGLTRETVTSIINRLISDNLIEIKNQNIIIKNIDNFMLKARVHSGDV